MAIYELEQRIFFDGAAAVQTADAVVEHMQSSDTTHASNADTTQTSSSDVSHTAVDVQHNVDTGQTHTDNSSASHIQASSAETQAYIDGITGHSDALTHDSAPNVLVVSEMVKNFNALENSANANTIVVKLAPGENLDTLPSDIKTALNGEKASSIGFAAAEEHNVDGGIKLTDSQTLTADSVLSNPEQSHFFSSLNDILADNGSIDFLTADMNSTVSRHQLIENIDSIVHSLYSNGNTSSDHTGNTITNDDCYLTKFLSEYGNVDIADKYFDANKVTDLSGSLALSHQYGGDVSEVVFIDSAVKDPQKIVDSLSKAPEVVYLHSGQDGVKEITDYLQDKTNIDTIRIISEGNYRQIMLGSDVITTDNIGKYKEAIASWQGHLSHGGDILFYGCNIAKDNAGQNVLGKIADWTGADIAASTNTTGLQGDWNLEYSIGAIQAHSITVADYDHNLSTYTVSNGNDSGPDSLRQAIIDANANAGNDTITIDNIVVTITIDTQLDTIIDGVTINGGDGVTVQVAIPGSGAGATAARVFYLDPGAGKTIAINDMTIMGGNISSLAGENSYGGSIYINSGTVNIDDTVITGSKAFNGGCVYNNGATVNFTNSIVSYGVAGGSGSFNGGGIYSMGGAFTINNSTFSGNSAWDTSGTSEKGGGGAIYANGATLTIFNSTIDSNQAKYGGGIRCSNNTTGKIYNSTFSNNSTYWDGAGINIHNSTYSLINSTFSDNTARTGGGAVIAAGTSVVNVESSTIANNTGGSTGGGIKMFDTAALNIRNSIMSNNYSTGMTRSDFNLVSGTVHDYNYNIVGKSTGYTWSGTGDITGDVNGVVANLSLASSLADNGGPTKTLAIGAGSVAINIPYTTGSTIYNNCYSLDQRGYLRPGGVSDLRTIGAVEYNGTAPTGANNYITQYNVGASSTAYWDEAANWYVYDGTSWVNATHAPTSADGTIIVDTNSTVTVRNDVTVDQTTIRNGGTVVVNAGKTFCVADGFDPTDLDVNGTITVNGNFTALATSGINISGTATSLGTFTANSSTFNFDGVDQTIPDGAYYNLTVSVSGIKTVSPSASSISHTGTISDAAKVLLAVSAAGVDKVYNGNTVATVNLSTQNIFTAYAVTPSYTAALFLNKNVGAGKTVNVTDISLNNAKFTLNGVTTASTTANITAAPLTLTADNQTKGYERTFTFNGTEFMTNGIVGGDMVTSATIASSATSISANIGTYPITISNAVGTGLGNYSIAYVNGSFIVRAGNAQMNDGTETSDIGDDSINPINSSDHPDENFGVTPWKGIPSTPPQSVFNSGIPGFDSEFSDSGTFGSFGTGTSETTNGDNNTGSGNTDKSSENPQALTSTANSTNSLADASNGKNRLANTLASISTLSGFGSDSSGTDSARGGGGAITAGNEQLAIGGKANASVALVGGSAAIIGLAAVFGPQMVKKLTKDIKNGIDSSGSDSVIPPDSWEPPQVDVAGGNENGDYFFKESIYSSHDYFFKSSDLEHSMEDVAEEKSKQVGLLAELDIKA